MGRLEHDSVHADFEMDPRDLFRVNLNLAKWRLLAGVLIFAVFAGLVVAFFWYIDEELIFWELSPLFLGLPLLAVGGQVLRLHATCRKFVAELPTEQRRIQFMFQPQTDGFDVNSGESFGHIAWKDVMKVTEMPSYFLIYKNRFEIRILPKRALHQPSDVSLLRAILRTHLGSKARLLQQ